VQLELVIEFMRSFSQNGSGGARDFRPNAVARKKDNSLFHLCPWQKQQTQKTPRRDHGRATGNFAMTNN